MQYLSGSFAGMNTGLHPQRSLEDEVKVQNVVQDTMKNHPKLGIWAAQMRGEMALNGDKKDLAKFDDYISQNYGREADITSNQFDRNLQSHRDIANQEYQMKTMELDLARKKAVADALGDQWKKWDEIENRKDAPWAQVQEARAAKASLMDKAGEIPITFNDANGKPKTMTMGTRGVNAEY